MRLIFTAAAAALLSIALSGCQTGGTSNETTGSISSGKIKSSSMSFGYSSRPYGTLISSYAKTNGVPEALAHAVISVESNYRPTARGSAGEIGLMQIKPATARMMGYRGTAKGLYNPETNIKYGMLYLAKAHQLGGGSTCGTILKYNAGHGAKRMNPVSKRYCGKVAKLMQ
jgi:soluble lytic murein transglycosylase-like protein